MIPRILAVAGPLFVYSSLSLLAFGLWHERKRFDRLALAPALAGLLASLVFVPSAHQLFFDEDIYINIASNLTHAPVAQLTILGGPDGPEVSGYYKEPPGWPVVLSLVFWTAGTTEAVAFATSRLLFALAIAAVYQLACAAGGTRKQALLAASVFAAAPVCFWFSASAGTDIPAALFGAIGLWGCLAGNGPLAAAGLALAAHTRLELIALTPLILLIPAIQAKWKVAGLALAAVAAAHIGWLTTIVPDLAEAERVSAVFSPAYLAGNLTDNLKYLANPLRFPAAATVAAAMALYSIIKKKSVMTLAAVQFGILSVVYLLFYAGSFEMNPRYGIQILAPLAVMAASAVRRPVWFGLIAVSIVAPHFGSDAALAPPRAHETDHDFAVQMSGRARPEDLVISPEPELFLNHGVRAVNVVFLAELKDKLEMHARSGRKTFYHAGIRTLSGGGREQQADQWVKSNFELHLIETRQIDGVTVAFYEVSL
jgi:hypothetical protein